MDKKRGVVTSGSGYLTLSQIAPQYLTYRVYPLIDLPILTLSTPRHPQCLVLSTLFNVVPPPLPDLFLDPFPWHGMLGVVAGSSNEYLVCVESQCPT